jgi:hypothetical protein
LLDFTTNLERVEKVDVRLKPDIEKNRHTFELTPKKIPAIAGVFKVLKQSISRR